MNVSTTERPFPTEAPAEFSGHIEGLRRGNFVVPQCQDCAHLQWPPRAACGTCGSSEFQDHILHNLHGRVITWTVVRRAFHPWFIQHTPYGVAVVETENNLRLSGWYGGSEVDELYSGLVVYGTIEEFGGSPGLVWRPQEEPNG